MVPKPNTTTPQSANPAVAADNATMTNKKGGKSPKNKSKKPVEVVEESEDEGMDVDTPVSSAEEEEEEEEHQEEMEAVSAPSPARSKKSNNGAHLVAMNAKAAKERLGQENEFVTSVLSYLHVPKHKNQRRDDDEEEEDDEVEMSGANARKLFASKKDRAKSVSELKERFDKKMRELRGQKSDDDDETDGKKKKKQKKGKLTKLERREKAKQEKKLKKKLGPSTSGAKGADVIKAAQRKGAGNQVKPVYNSDGKMVFSKFDFTEESAEAKKKPTLDPKAALKKLQKDKDKLKSLEAIGKTERVKTLAEKTAWKTALDKAEGVKVKDDEGLLKKSIKKIEQKKKSAKKKWEGRSEGVEKRKEGKQKKRAENIQKRKDSVKQNKMKKQAKRGRVVPGFK